MILSKEMGYKLTQENENANNALNANHRQAQRSKPTQAAVCVSAQNRIGNEILVFAEQIRFSESIGKLKNVELIK